MKRKLTIFYRIKIILPVNPEKVDDLPTEMEQAIYEGEAPIEYLNKQGYDTSGIQHMEAEVMDEPVCRCCGCTEDNACVDDMDGHTCEWAEDDLCSFCVGKEETPDEPLPFGNDYESKIAAAYYCTRCQALSRLDCFCEDYDDDDDFQPCDDCDNCQQCVDALRNEIG